MASAMKGALTSLMTLSSTLVGCRFLPEWLGLQANGSSPIVQPPITESSPPLSDLVSEDGKACVFWTAEKQVDTETECSYSALRFMTTTSVNLYADLATRCAAPHAETCILSSEVGFEIPSVFLWNQTTLTMRPIVAPRLLKKEKHTQKRVVVMPPSLEVDVAASIAKAESSTYTFATTVDVEHINPNTMRPMSDRLTDYDAFCVQLLFRSLSEECVRAFGMNI